MSEKRYLSTVLESNNFAIKYLFFSKAVLKVIPLKLFYYQTFFETWHNQHS